MSELPEIHRMPLLEHLRELRTRVMYAMGAVIVGMCLGVFFVEPIYAALTAPIRMLLPDVGGGDPAIDAWYRMMIGPLSVWLESVDSKGTLAITTSPLEGVFTYFRVAFISGLVMASPVCFYQLWAFVAPGLYSSEKRMVGPIALASTGLFVLGMSFAYFILFPLAFPFFITVLDAEAVLSVSGYLDTVVKMMVAFGVCFQLPVVIWFLARMGIVDHHDLISGFRYAVVGIFIAAALLTPPEITTQIALAIPLVFLYCVGIGVAWMVSTKVRLSSD